MSDLSSPGIGSGLDIKAMVDAIVNAKITPLQVQQDKQLKKVTTEISAVGQLKSSLADLRTAVNALSELSSLYTMKFSMSDTGYFTPTITSDAVKGIYQIQVNALAQKHTLATGYFSSNTDPVGSGTMTIKFGTYNSDQTTFTQNSSAAPVNIVIPADATSLTSVCDAINNSNSGVTASIIQDNQGSRLAISSAKTGENYAMQISGDLTALNYDPTTGVNALTQTLAAQNSLVKINGLTVSQSSNQLKNAISGVDLNLTKAQAGTTINLTIDDNKDQLTNSINDFIKKYNDTMTLLTNLTGYNAETEQAGVYQGDPQFRSLKLNITKLTTNQIGSASSAVRSLSDIGIKTNRQGLLEINKDKFNNALSNNYNDIGKLFAKTASVSDGTIRVNSVGKRATAGVYEINLTEYTPGVSMSGTIGNSPATSGDGVNLNGSGALSSLSLEVIGGTTGPRGTVTITDGIAAALDKMIGIYIDNKGDLNQRAEQLNNNIKQLGKSQIKIDMRKEIIEKKYMQQFTKLDEFLAKMKDTSETIDRLIGQLPSSKS